MTTLGSAAIEPLALALAIGYLLAGIAVAMLLGRRGHATAVCLGALVCWPLFVPLVGASPRPSVVRGPLHERIVAVTSALREATADPAAAGLHLPEDLDRLVDELHRADERLAIVDRLLANITGNGAPLARGVADGIAQLQRARSGTADAIAAVLDGAVQLRLQIGLRALAGNSVPVQERLRDLRGRLAAIDEIAELELHP